MENELVNEYMIEGNVGGAVGAVIGLIVGVGVSVLVLTFVGVLGGQTYQLTEGQIDAISNATIKGYITSGIASGFQALQTTGQYLPIIVLAVVITLVMALILSLTATTGGGMGGSAL